MPKGMFVKVSIELRKKQHINKKAGEKKHKQIKIKLNCIGQKVIFYQTRNF